MSRYVFEGHGCSARAWLVSSRRRRRRRCRCRRCRRHRNRLDLNYPPSAKECFVGDEDTLAVQVDDTKVEIYKYDDSDGAYKLIQDAIRDDLMVSVSFDNEYLVYSTRKAYDCYETKGLYIYRRLETYQPYFLEQNITVSDSIACSSPTEDRAGNDRRGLFHIVRTGLESSTHHDGDVSDAEMLSVETFYQKPNHIIISFAFGTLTKLTPFVLFA